MALTYPYADGYLAPLLTDAREDRAEADVAALGTLPAAWVQRLVILRAYIITCLECQKMPDDTFGTKLSAYRKEWEPTLAQARSAQKVIDDAAGTGTSYSPFSVSLERG